MSQAHWQHTQASEELRAGHDHKAHREAIVINEPTEQSRPGRANGRANREVQSEEHVYRRFIGNIGQGRLHEGPFGVYGKTCDGQ